MEGKCRICRYDGGGTCAIGFRKTHDRSDPQCRRADFTESLQKPTYHQQLLKDSVVFPWMIQYAGVLHMLFCQEDSWGLTPFQPMKGRTWQAALPNFGEVVDYRRRAKSKLDARW